MSNRRITGEDRRLDDALEATFPASDPLAASGTTASLTHSTASVADPAAAAKFDAYVISAAPAGQMLSPTHLSRESTWASAPSDTVRLALSPAAAVLDLLETLEGPTPEDLFLLHVAIPSASVLMPAELPRDWQSDPAPVGLQAFGDAWRERGNSLAMRIPSRMCPGEFNLLVNLDHPDCGDLHVVTRSPFRLDPRLRI